jgi:tetratricopeptide (TPR) repeat protein
MNAARTPTSPFSAQGPLLLAGVLALLAFRVLAAWLPGRALWGFDLGRDLPRLGWTLSILACAAACVPAVGRLFARGLPAGGVAKRVLVAASVLALATFVIEHPDRALFTGDARLRHGEFAALQHPETLAPQASAGDLLLHHAIPRWLSRHTRWSAEDVGRAQGALLAMLAAVAGWAIAAVVAPAAGAPAAQAAGRTGRAGRAGGADRPGTRAEPGLSAVSLAVVAITAGTAALALDNGYGKATAELCALASVMAAGLVRLARDGRGLGKVGIALAVALLLHRSALALVPAWLVAAGVALRGGRGREPAALLGVLAPIATLAFVGPRLWQVATTFDRAHHLAAASGGPALAVALSSAHLADVCNALALLAPVAPLLPLLLALEPRPGARGALLAAAFVLPPLAMLVIVTPQQGLPRDWDVFAFVGALLSALAAWRTGVVLAAAPRARWLAGALALVAILPALQWAALQSDDDRMWSRAESIWIGPPIRDQEERARGLATLGLMRFARGEYAKARELLERSLAISPNPRMLVSWGITTALAGRTREAYGYYVRAAELNPDLASAWQGVAELGVPLSDAERVRRAVAQLERLEPGNPALAPARRWLGISQPR